MSAVVIKNLTKRYGQVYLAENVQQTTQKLEVTEEDMLVSSFTEEDFLRMVRNGEIIDAPTIAALTMMREYLSK